MGIDDAVVRDGNVRDHRARELGERAQADRGQAEKEHEVRIWLAGLGSVLGCLVAGKIHALDPPVSRDQSQFLAGLRFGTNQLGIGLGARGGYTFVNQVYLGGAFEYFTGERRSRDVGTTHTSGRTGVWLGSIEVGYDVGLLRKVVLRPWGGLGLGWTHGKSCETTPGVSTCATTTQSDSAFALGVIGVYALGPFLFGPEIRWLVASKSSFVVGANAGFIF
jgi:opacity protein-like surface antigen